MTSRTRYSILLVALLVLMALGMLYIDVRCHASLRTACFVSGWILSAMLGAIAIAWWWRPLDLMRQPWVHLCLGATLALGFASHVEYRIPNGWLDLALTTVFAAALVGAGVGAILIRRSASDQSHPGETPSTPNHDARARRWLMANVAVLYSLLAMALVHAGVMHSHGFVAHFIAGR